MYTSLLLRVKNVCILIDNSVRLIVSRKKNTSNITVVYRIAYPTKFSDRGYQESEICHKGSLRVVSGTYQIWGHTVQM